MLAERSHVGEECCLDARAGLESQFAEGIEGHCEACGVYSTSLMWDRNLLVCPECRAG